MKFKIGQVEIEVNNEDVSKAIETGELELQSDKLIEKSDDMVIYESKEDFEKYTENIKKEEYKATKTKALEIAMKDVRDAFGFSGEEIEGYKDPQTLASKVTDKIIENAKIKPDTKINELTADLEKVRNNLKEKENEFEQYKTQITQKETRAKKDKHLMSLLPENGISVSPKIALLALKDKGIDINFNEEKAEITFNGETIKDPTTLEPTDGKNFVIDKLQELEIFKKPEGGNGGGDETGEHKAGSYDAFVLEMKKQNIEEGTVKFSEEMSKRIKDKTLVL